MAAPGSSAPKYSGPTVHSGPPSRTTRPATCLALPSFVTPPPKTWAVVTKLLVQHRTAVESSGSHPPDGAEPTARPRVGGGRTGTPAALAGPKRWRDGTRLRVSTTHQDLERQLDALGKHGIPAGRI